MATPLPSNVKRFIVKLLAVGHVPSEVVSAVAQEFSLDVSSSAVNHYNPTKAQGEALSASLKELFYATRKAARERAMEDLPLGAMSERMTLLRGIVERNAGKADKITAAAIEAARREMVALDIGDADGMFAGVFRVVNSLEVEAGSSPNIAPAATDERPTDGG